MSAQHETIARSLPVPVDPWETQRELMAVSGQPRPSAPMLSKNSLMYLALILEELSETIRDGVMPALLRVTESGPQSDIARELLQMRGALQDIADGMTITSVGMRQQLAELGDFAIPLTLEEAKGALDGTTDLAVVNCGFALASGLPGAKAYAEVARSNMSKRNPETGRIDKTPDGKWIPGREFSPPDLAPILDAVMPRK
jgi:hypothetical protein